MPSASRVAGWGRLDPYRFGLVGRHRGHLRFNGIRIEAAKDPRRPLGSHGSDSRRWTNGNPAVRRRSVLREDLRETARD